MTGRNLSGVTYENRRAVKGKFKPNTADDPVGVGEVDYGLEKRRTVIMGDPYSFKEVSYHFVKGGLTKRRPFKPHFSYVRTLPSHKRERNLLSITFSVLLKRCNNWRIERVNTAYNTTS